MALRYLEIAGDLRRRIQQGEFTEAGRLPTVAALKAQYDSNNDTLRSALNVLKAEGLVRAVKKSGLLLRGQVVREALDRDGIVRRDASGFLVGHRWPPLTPPAVERLLATLALAEYLQVDPGVEILAVDQILGRRDEPLILETRYLPPRLAAMDAVTRTVRAAPERLDQVLEFDLGYGPLRWQETISSRLPNAVEAGALKISEITPLLCFAVLVTSAAGDPLALCDTRVASDRFHVVRDLVRDLDAT